jgi:hypothetical protein
MDDAYVPVDMYIARDSLKWDTEKREVVARLEEDPTTEYDTINNAYHMDESLTPKNDLGTHSFSSLELKAANDDTV